MLPPEILVYHILPLLLPEDILNFYDGMSLPVTEEVYRACFKDNTCFNEYNLQMLKERAHTDLYFFGNPESASLIPPSGQSGNFEWLKRSHGYKCLRSCRPAKIRLAGFPIVKVSDTLVLTVLDSHGQAFQGGVYALSEDVFEMATTGKLARYHPHLTDIAVQRYGYFAVDGQGRMWKSPFLQRSLLGNQNYQLTPTRKLASSISKISAFTDYIMAQHKNGSIKFWGVDNRERTNPDLIYGDTLCSAEVGSGVRMFEVTGSLCAMLMKDGSVRVEELFVHFHRVTSQLERLMRDLAKHGPFSMLFRNSAGSFALVSRTGQLVVVSRPSPRNKLCNIEVKSLPDRNIASVAVGAHHTLALTKQGEVYVQGFESDCNGCLGLGSFEDAREMEGVVYGILPMITRTPTLSTEEWIKLDLPGRAYGVYAGADYSAVLICKE